MAKKKNTDVAADATEAPVAAPKAAKVQQPQANGITMPREGSKTRAVWDSATALSDQKQAPATLAEVREQCEAAGLNTATIQTQYVRWRKFYGLPPQGRVIKEAAPAAPASVPAE